MSIPIRYILQAIEMENKKIFISGIDTKLGFHLVQKLRDDHLDLQNYSYLVGSSDSPIRSQNTNTAIHAIVNFKKDPALLGKAVLESDVIILDIRNATDEAEYIIKLIQWKAKERKQENNNGRVSLEDQINKNYVIIGIGSHMTWAHEKSTLAKLEGNDKQQAIAKFIAFDYQKQEKIKDSDRNKRITHHSWMRERQIEKSLLALNKKSCVRSCILTTGLFYGKDFPSNEISNIVAKCFSLDEEVYVYGQGNNYMPTVHVDDFCEHLDLTIKLLQEKTSVNPLNLISVDENLCTQQEIAETLLKCSGFIKEIKKKQLVYLTKIQDLHSWSVPLLRSTIFNRLPTKSKSFCKYFCQNFSEITEYVELENYHYVLYSQEMQQQIIQQLDTHLTGLIQVFREQDVTAQISKMRSNPKQEIDIHQVSRAIEQGFLKLHNQQSYVLILNQILLDVEVVKKYNLRKFQLGEVPEILRPKFQLPVLDAQLTSENPDHDNQTNQQQVEKQENTGMKIHKQQQKQKQQMNDKQQDVITKRNKKYAQKVDQYLLDNVNCYLSQAFFLLRQKQEPNLPEFIQALKTIYSRQMRVYDEQIKI